MEKIQEIQSDLEQILENRVRKSFEFEVMDYIGGSKKSLGKIRIRVATFAEKNEAIFLSHKYIEKAAKDSNQALIDSDLVNTAKAVFILWKVCLHPTENIPVFQRGPEWMMKNLSTDEIGKIFEYYQTILREFSPFDLDLSEQKVIAIAEACAATAETDAPNVILSRFTTDQKAELVIRISQKLAEAQAELKKLKEIK